MLRVDRHDDPERGCRLIEIALCNDRETPRKIPVNAWLYQTKLTVDGGRGRTRSCRSPTRCSTTGAERGRRAAAAEPAVPGPAGVRGRADLLGRLGGGRRARGGRPPGVDDLAADVRDAAGHRRGDRRALLDMRELAAATAGRAARRAVADRRSGTPRGWTARRPGRSSFPSTCATRAWTRSPRRGRCSASSRPGSSTCWPTRRRCAASGS